MNKFSWKYLKIKKVVEIKQSSTKIIAMDRIKAAASEHSDLLQSIAELDYTIGLDMISLLPATMLPHTKFAAQQVSLKFHQDQVF